uniref:Uncharacterized protein n=1 Tax=Arundo donax TaxID=35708 RepID=A0A0A9C3W1_ARUDO
MCDSCQTVVATCIFGRLIRALLAYWT